MSSGNGRSYTRTVFLRYVCIDVESDLISESSGNRRSYIQTVFLQNTFAPVFLKRHYWMKKPILGRDPCFGSCLCESLLWEPRWSSCPTCRQRWSNVSRYYWYPLEKSLVAGSANDKSMLTAVHCYCLLPECDPLHVLAQAVSNCDTKSVYIEYGVNNRSIDAHRTF